MSFYLGSPTSLQKTSIAMENFLPACSTATHRWHHPAFSSLDHVTHPPHWLVGTYQIIMSCLLPLTIEDLWILSCHAYYH
ncbi:Uncharacterized protein TCM_005097 [Theobroma cacao]|uniref:Uncharacterized protein n=1 Tax=Theobroma cacao TaxID=3641 RepID=A0A061E057_THECC|nr:Uncharacterized protein TCM_005097 [Theobroma cacao]